MIEIIIHQCGLSILVVLCVLFGFVIGKILGEEKNRQKAEDADKEKTYWKNAYLNLLDKGGKK